MLEGVTFSLQDSFAIFAEMGVPVTRRPARRRRRQVAALARRSRPTSTATTAEIVEAEEGAAYGAAILAGVGAGAWPSVDGACKAIVKVAIARCRRSRRPWPRCDEVYADWRRIYPALEGHRRNGSGRRLRRNERRPFKELIAMSTPCSFDLLAAAGRRGRRRRRSLTRHGHAAAPASFYDLETKALDGKPADLAQYKGKVAAGRQRRQQVRLHAAVRRPREAAIATSSRKGFAVLGFPSNDFGGQEPGTAEEIASSARLTYDVTLPAVREGRDQGRPDAVADLPVPRRDGQPARLELLKYVIGKDGKVVAFFPSKVTPDAPELQGGHRQGAGELAPDRRDARDRPTRAWAVHVSRFHVRRRVDVRRCLLE